MEWLNALSDIVQRYSGQGGGAAAAPADAHEDFQQVARTAPQEVVADGISQMFRSDQTPAFPQMIGDLFRRSDPNQRAGLLERLLGSLGPGALGALPGIGGLLGAGGGGQVTPHAANQVSPEQVQELATHAERKDPSIVDKVSNFYAQHPQLVQAAGGLALTVALQHMMRRR